MTRQTQETAVSSRQSWRTTLVIAAGIIGAQTAIDLTMGGEAEYFNAYTTLTRLTQWIHGQAPTAPMIYGQEDLGMLGLPLATTILIGLPLLVAHIIVRAAQVVLNSRHHGES